LNLTVCTAAIYILSNTNRIKKWTFRVLVLGIFLSLIYDLIWFLLFNDINNDLEDGGVTRSVRTFSLLVAYLQFFFKVKSNYLNTLDHSRHCFLEGLT
jgi:hypothetical protein